VSNFVTEDELNSIKGLLHYVNENLHPPGCKVTFTADLDDENGDSLGKVEFDPAVDRYVLRFPRG
jgi:hypothetical protein